MKLAVAFHVSCAVLALPAAAQTLLQTHTGSVGDEYGHAVLQTADQNGDGYVDVLVGAPGWNGDRGYIRCLSGKYLATGTGSFALWTLYSTANAGARFGSSIAEVGTLTGNSATDYIVGAPGVTSIVSTGALMLIDGSTHTVAWTMNGDFNTRLGESIAALGDQDGDGKVDIASTAPATNNSANKVHVISGSSFGVNATLQSSQHVSLSASPYNQFGTVVASGFDLDHDGRFDLAIGSPDISTGGYLMVCRAEAFFPFLGGYFGDNTDERMSASIDGTRDFDGDGVVDFVVGAPNFADSYGSQLGRVVVLSGAKLLANTPPFEIHTLSTASSGFLGYAYFHFGTSVRASADLNGDGIADFLVGAPDYFSTFPSASNLGFVAVCSGATGARIETIIGAVQDHLGDALLGGFLDFDHDGFLEFAVAGSLSDNSNVDCGTLKFYRLFPASPATYCTAKINSLGCTPSMWWSGTASASSSSPCLITCSSVINQKMGLLMYSHAPNATAFQGGTLCVKAPLTRTATQNSGGSASGSDCTGAFSFDFNARIQSGVDPTLVVGAQLFTQYWSRDSASPSATSLSNALRLLINP